MFGEMRRNMNQLYHGDNLSVLRSLPDASVDLICTDPPFNTGKNWGAFSDKWKGGLKEYLKFMELRVVEMRRVLKVTGSLYLHCDPTVSHYLKVMLDGVFGIKQFRNEIVWAKRFGHANDVKRKFPVLHDVIFLYSKTDSYTFNPSYKPLSKDYVKSIYRHVDENGRRYRLNPVCKLRVRNKKTRTYLDESKGICVGSLWVENDTKLSSFSKERVGYPTQKPVALYERMIKASSHQGDIVLDPFVGSGASLDAAELLGRHWVGIDSSDEAIKTIQKRLEDRHCLLLEYDLIRLE